MTQSFQLCKSPGNPTSPLVTKLCFAKTSAHTVSNVLFKSKGRRLISLNQHRKITQKREKDEYFNRLLCLYDGLKLRSYNQNYIEWLLLKEQRLFYKLKPTLNPATDMVEQYHGKYENMDLHIHVAPSGWVVDFSGSIHKFFNIICRREKQNYNDFYWEDFLIAYDELVKVLAFDPKEIYVVNLEVGVNCTLPACIPHTVPEIMESFLSVFGVYKNKSWIQESDRDTYKVCRGERYLKFYDKSIQNKLEERVVRLELGYERARQIIRDSEATSFYDLTKLSTLFKLKYHLIEAFKTLHTSNPDFTSLADGEIKADKEILKYSKATFWRKLKKENRYRYEQKRKNHERLINKYCSYNLSIVILKMLMEKVS